ncbi:MAG: LLM class flavin-dependent oxidoreductase [Alphaproteobacteria bacterium]|jgi:alkanesulfonate monooxygenase SsuD/methylene tetrahydromethanopterin reductase-like flavin-dependent oxidoreductase (luciferase family)|nr:LLM class flavin-dependent oxidoreductase [Alphaproteobacteria bacterium]MDP6563399.1 LLM class flavin-dependent oxidoreductase [Alphaproteobacteria bacterium]MDP6812119.1 LLM class flavin-dependent oxidoreductase [Alphaproteobacteria bacterium]
MQGIEFGVFDHLDYGGGDLGELYRTRLALIEVYDAAGFRAYHQAEHHGTDLGAAPSPALFLAAAAQRSRRLRLGAMVFCLPLYHPVRLLEEVCMLDQISDGRLELGVGRGISPIEGDFFDVDASEAPAMYREALELILAGLTADELDFKGDYYRVEGMPMVLTPRQRPHPPLWLGIGLPDSAVWPAENAINVISNQTVDRVRAIADRYRQVWAERGGDAAALPLIGMTRHLVIAEDRDEALALARRAYLPWRAAFYRLWDRHGMSPVGISFPESIDELFETGQAIAGTPGEVADEIAGQIADSGINYFLCRFAFGDMSLAEARRSVDLFASIMPALKAGEGT